MNEPQGIDISNAQGARWPWAAERGKIAFGMVKATEGLSFTDPDFAANTALTEEVRAAIAAKATPAKRLATKTERSSEKSPR